MPNQFVFFSVAALLVGAVRCVRDKPSPILIVPGHGGSQLNVLDTRDGDCNTNGETHSVWLNVSHIETLPQCFSSQLRLDVANGYSDASGVTVTAPGFGSTSSVEFLGTDIPYMNELVDYFVQRGYVRNVNIRTAPYDWRLAAKQLTQRGYYSALKELIEQMYRDNGDAKVTLVVHSMGGPVSLHFLTQTVSQEWKDTYIDSYVTLGAVFGGSNIAISFLLGGPINTEESDATEEEWLEFLNFITMNVGIPSWMSQYRSYPSNYWLAPPASILDDQILIITPTKNYTAKDYHQMFIDAGYPQGYTQLTDNPLKFPAPNVPTYCFYGLEFPTPETVVYGNGLSETATSILYGEGDNIANKASLEVCQQWADSGYPFNRTVFENIDHNNVTTADVILKAIGRIVGGSEEPINVCVLPADPGPCSETLPRYYFNSETKTCEAFTYGGCLGNKNNFEDLGECTKLCNPSGSLKKTEL